MRVDLCDRERWVQDKLEWMNEKEEAEDQKRMMKERWLLLVDWSESGLVNWIWRLEGEMNDFK